MIKAGNELDGRMRIHHHALFPKVDPPSLICGASSDKLIDGGSFQSPAASGSRTGVDSEVPLVNSKLVPGGAPAPGERNGHAMTSKDSGERRARPSL